MKKFNLLKIFLIASFLLMPISCNNHNNKNTNEIELSETSIDTFNIVQNEEIVFGKSIMYNAFEREFSKYQFDSICKADQISNNLRTWHAFTTRDGETREIITEYMYIKYTNQAEYIYRLIRINDNTYKITKRIKK